MGTYPPHRSSDCGYGPVYKSHAVHDKNVQMKGWKTVFITTK